MKKQKGEVTKYFNPRRPHYTDKDGNYVYTYQQLQDDGTYVDVKTIIELTDETVNIIRVLQESDHEIDLQDIYEDRRRDKFVTMVDSNNDNNTSKIDNIPDKKMDIYKLLFEDDEHEDSKYDDFMATLTENQRDLIYDHINLGKSLAQISKESKGKLTPKALEHRWLKIRDLARVFFSK